MASGTWLYRALVQLYPAQFRRHYGDDLVAHFNDLVRRDGIARAWGRTSIDLLVTLPRYRMETIMNSKESSTTLVLVAAAVAAAPIAGFALGLVPALILLVIASAFAFAQRGRLAASVRVGSPQRQHGLRAASIVLLIVAVATLGVGVIDLGGRDSWPNGRLLAYNSLFFASLVAALSCGLASRRPRQLNN